MPSRGPKPKPWPDHAMHAYRGEWRDVIGHGVSSKRKCYWALLCDKGCTTYKSIMCVCKSPASSLNCRKCKVFHRDAKSKYVLSQHVHVYEVVSSLAGPLCQEGKLFQGNTGAADICVPQTKEIIQIDGRGHHSQGRFGVSLAYQQVVDKNFNDQALEAGYRVLRLHDNDIKHVDIVFKAFRMHVSPLVYSPSWKQTPYGHGHVM